MNHVMERTNKMSKLIKLLKMVFAVAIFFCIILIYQGVNPRLNSIKVVEENEVGLYVSPNGEKRISVYFNGGLILGNDLTYVGVLEDSTSDLRKNIFLVAPSVKEVRWINNELIIVNGTEIAIDDTYDFRDTQNRNRELLFN